MKSNRKEIRGFNEDTDQTVGWLVCEKGLRNRTSGSQKKYQTRISETIPLKEAQFDWIPSLVEQFMPQDIDGKKKNRPIS